MNIIRKYINCNIYRITVTIALILFFHKEIVNSTRLPRVIVALILLMEMVLFFVKDIWWNKVKYITIWFITISAAICLQYIFGMNTTSLLNPLVGCLGLMDSRYSYLSVILASLTIIVIFCMTANSSILFQTIFGLLGIYFGIRSIRIRQEAYRTSQLHLKELNEAHMELKQALAELQEASVHSMRYAALEERARLSREIHDGIGHQLTSLIIELQALEIMLQEDTDKASELVAELLQISRRSMSEVRLAVREWSDDEMGLGIIALKGLVSQTQAHSSIKFDFYQDSEVSEWAIQTSIVLYRVLQESFTNILRHSRAKSVEVHIKESNGNIILTVSDDGQYKGDIPLTPGFGMKGIMERCNFLGGLCKIIPEEPHGLKIEVTLPIETEQINECST